MMKFFEICKNLLINFKKLIRIWWKTLYFKLWAIFFNGSRMNFFQKYIFIIWEGSPKKPIITLDRNRNFWNTTRPMGRITPFYGDLFRSRNIMEFKLQIKQKVSRIASFNGIHLNLIFRSLQCQKIWKQIEKWTLLYLIKFRPWYLR
jgi:hypothetical protein